MSKQTPSSFFPWLDSHLKDLDLTDSQLSKKAGLSHSVISKARSGERGIGWDAGVAISQALDLPPEIVLKRLELLPTSAEERQRGAVVDEMLHIVPDLSVSDQEELLQLARLKLERRKKESRGKKVGI
jgi:transcriptional regulator with XRE-family HTH domain